MPVGELLFKITGEASRRRGVSGLVARISNCMCLSYGPFSRALEVHIPLLNLVELLEERDGDKDDDSLLASPNLYLRHRIDTQSAKTSMHPP